jgi:hypothetical protein
VFVEELLLDQLQLLLVLGGPQPLVLLELNQILEDHIYAMVHVVVIVQGIRDISNRLQLV